VAFCEALPDKSIDIMLEVKDKNLSVIKCALCLKNDGHISDLERQWSLYKYLVLEKNPSGYAAIRQLLKDKTAYPALEFYDVIEKSLDADENIGYAVNAAQHVWGYFKSVCTKKQKTDFEKLMVGYAAGSVSLTRIKKFLLKLSIEYHISYLLDSYYFLGLS
jgi:UV DNA damage endonuclease